MSQPKDHLSDLDRHVQLLESKVNQLRASLNHWQQWYLEYSALKEEVEQLPKDTPPLEDLRRIRRDFDSKLLTKKEVNEILGKNDLRDTERIISMLLRRMDYVEQNIASLTKLLESEENKLAAASVVAQPDAGTDEESGLPITDIIEELDEDDNVVNFRLQSGGDIQPQVVEALKKVGIHDLPETEADLPRSEKAPATSANVDEAKKESTPVPSPESAPDVEPPSARKTVSFAQDTKPGHEASEARASPAAQTLERLMQKAKEQEAMDMSSAVIPENESPEESQLRRDMLEYSMSEIGPVVAELQLEEDHSDDDGVDWDGTDDGFEDEDEDEDDDTEDELGRSKRSVITPDYIKRMQELEKRLGVQSAFTVGRTETEPKKPDEGIGRIAVVGESDSPTATSTDAPRQKKSVSFASKLDIAPDSAPRPTPNSKPKMRKVEPVNDVVEKTDIETLAEPEEAPKRVSRFKKERAATASTSPAAAKAVPPGPHQLRAALVQDRTVPPAEPTPPEDQTLATTIVERPVASEAAEPDEMDDALLYQAAAVEYNRLRNQLIQKQGGFVQDEAQADESGRVPLDEELGGPKRMSKFKAARLAKLQ
ncbi:Prefoldin subunit-domain-containing protein [Madurella fahalii]|uniref:Prefoldin subunit-domain-containing protein n=1 Tax=Madurella fahalii TaxID=1157608 RepID=A0ABQ0FZT6_9PEZI